MARVLSSVHAISTTCSLCWTSLCAACLYIITRPDSRFLCTRAYILWFSVAWGSATFWWQSNACNCSMFCACTRSGLPHNVVHFLVMHSVYYNMRLSYSTTFLALQGHCMHTALMVKHLTYSPVISDVDISWSLVNKASYYVVRAFHSCQVQGSVLLK